MQAFVILVWKMYSPPLPSKKQTIKQIAIYVLMTLSVVVVVSLLIFFMLGFRIDRSTGTIEQGGLVQLNSIPSGASITIDAARLSATTSTKTTLAAGQHSILMSRNGYLNWQKTVDVKSGTILWLNYARLIPSERPVDDVVALPAVTSSLASPNQKLYAMTTVGDPLTLRVAVIDSDTPEIKTVTIPEAVLAVSSDPQSDSLALMAWDSSSRYVLVEHRYNDATEWLVVDTEDGTRTKNISSFFDITLTKPQFSQDDSNILYGITNGDVRRIDIDNATISAPLVRNVAEFSFYDRTTLLYITAIDQNTKSRSVGYRNEGASEPRAIRTYSDDGTMPLHVAMGKYYSQPYIAVAYGTTIDILSGSLPRSDSDTPLSLTAIATVSTPGQVDFLSNKTSGRFFVMQYGNSYSVYDLELQKVTTTTLRGEAVQQGELQWLDGYTLWSGLDSKLRFYEFDGANQNDIMSIATGQRPALSPNGRFIYAPTVDEKGNFHLSRVRLIL